MEGSGVGSSEYRLAGRLTPVENTGSRPADRSQRRETGVQGELLSDVARDFSGLNRRWVREKLGCLCKLQALTSDHSDECQGDDVKSGFHILILSGAVVATQRICGASITIR